MDGIDGLETTVKMRKSDNPNVSRLKIIALTASALKGDQEKFIASGADGYLSKVSYRLSSSLLLIKLELTLLVPFLSPYDPPFSKLPSLKPSPLGQLLDTLPPQTLQTKRVLPRVDSISHPTPLTPPQNLNTATTLRQSSDVLLILLTVQIWRYRSLSLSLPLHIPDCSFPLYPLFSSLFTKSKPVVSKYRSLSPLFPPAHQKACCIAV